MKKHLIKKLELKQKSVIIECLEQSPLFDYFRPSGIYRIHEKANFTLKSVKKMMSSFNKDKPPYLKQT